MLLTCSVPPPIPAASTCASLAYVYGPTRSEKNSNDPRASRSSAASPLSASCGNAQYESGTPRTTPPDRTMKRAIPSEYSHDEIGTSCLQCVRRNPPGRSSCSTMHAVRHHLVVGLRRHDQLAGRLVGGMVDHRQPLARAVVPVFAERRAIAVDVVEEAQAIAGDAVIGNGERDVLSRRRSRGKSQAQPIATVIDRHRLPL